MNKIELYEKCQVCNGTGIYSGMGESPTCGVVCNVCKGTGCYHFVHHYEVFKEKVTNDKIKWVYECNPGIKIGNGGGYKYSDFGGMSYEDWLNNKEFEIGMENRISVCPKWYYQSCNSDIIDLENWECEWGSFSNCSKFKEKEKCWVKFDKQVKGNNNG